MPSKEGLQLPGERSNVLTTPIDLGKRLGLASTGNQTFFACGESLLKNLPGCDAFCGSDDGERNRSILEKGSDGKGFPSRGSTMDDEIRRRREWRL